MKGYVVMIGQSGCLPDSYEYASNIREVREIAANLRNEWVQVISEEDLGLSIEAIPVDEFCRNNGLEPTEENLDSLLSA